MRRIASLMSFIAVSIATTAWVVPVRASDVVVEPEQVVRKIVAPTSPQTSGPAGLVSPYNRVPWGLDRLDQRSNTLDQSFAFAATGTGVKVYVVDSGVQATHPELGQRVIDGWSYRADSTALTTYKNSVGTLFSACPSNANSTNTHLMDPPSTFDAPANVDVSDKGKLDNDGHGTHVAGTIGGEYTGVAKNVSIVPVRVLDSCGNGTTTMVRKGLEWILADHAAGEPAIVNMSIGFDSSATTIDARIKLLIEEGIVVIAAAGNSASSACNTTPAGTAGTISVGAIGSTSKEASYSNFGECVDIFAPGSDIVSTWPKYGSQTNTYIAEYGTSMAAPHVAGAVAIYLQGKTTTIDTPAETWAWLKMNSTCDAVTYHDTTSRSATAQTPNRILNLGSAAGPACKPTTASAVAANNSATISWTEPSATNGSPILGYTATASPGGAACTSSSLLSCTLTGLTNNTAYTVSVTTRNAIGTSALAATTTVTPVGPPLAVVNPVATVDNKQMTISWAQPPGDGGGISYVVTASPGGASCTTTSTSCVVTGLVNGQSYVFSIVGSNAYGAATAVTVSGTPDGTPETPATFEYQIGNKSVTLAWPAVTTTLNLTYVVTASPGNLSCTTTTTSCTIVGLQNGIDYSFAITTQAPSGRVTTAATGYTARPGFTVLKTSVKKKSKTSLTTIVKSLSPGKRTWSETGLCSIKSGKLVAPAKTATCKVKLKVAKSGSFPAMSTTVVISVK